MDNSKNEDWQRLHEKQKEEIIRGIVEPKEIKNKKKQVLGWISIILAFVVLWGTLISFILSIILLTRKDQDRTLALLGLIFSSAIIILFFVIMPLISFK